jgi:hypothetical protein
LHRVDNRLDEPGLLGGQVGVEGAQWRGDDADRASVEGCLDAPRRAVPEPEADACSAVNFGDGGLG